MAADTAAFMEVTVVPRFLAYVSVDWMERYTAANTDSALWAATKPASVSCVFR